MKKLLLIVTGLSLSLAQCTQESENNTGLALAALALATPNCTVDGTQFFADGEVDCSSGTSAVATGTAFLSAAQTHGEVLSVQLTVDVGSSSGDKVVIKGHGTGRNATSAGFIEIDNAGNTQAGGADNSAGSDTGIAQNGDGTYCVEFHGEAEVHAIYEKAACAAKATTAADWDSEGNNGNSVTTGAPSGSNWGITLINSSISALTVNDDEIFGD